MFRLSAALRRGLAVVGLLPGLLAFQPPARTVLTTEYLRFGFDGTGRLVSIADRRGGEEFMPAGQAAPLLSLRFDSVALAPVAMQYQPARQRLTLRYPNGYAATLAVAAKGRYLRFELLRLTPRADVPLVLWGPFPTRIGEQVGETVGVAHHDRFGIGIQALNPKTLGGYPTHDSDIDPAYDIFQTGNLVDVAPDQQVLYRGQTAKPAPFGSVLQAYCRDRSRPRVIENGDYPRYEVPAFADGGVVGTAIALWGAPAAELLPTLERIELAENLPHPVLDGVWAKRSPTATASYLILNFGENTVDEAIARTKKAGLRYFYHGDPFETWGNFRLNRRDFPNDRAGLRACVDRAEAAGLRVGLHTLSNFITPNDPLVAPTPDRRLAAVGHGRLAAPLSAQATEVAVAAPQFFNQLKNNTLKTVRVGDELIQYQTVSEQAPWQLLGCTRGAFGTRAAAHAAGDTVAKLADHPYRVFLADAALQQEMAVRLADLFNETGLRQISFDGLEGCWASGLGQYAIQRFVNTWYDHLRPGLRGEVINDASTPGHFFWHIFTRMNWGEPWYAGFRESQTQYRLKNQAYFRRNLLPGMLGWFSLKAETSPEDLEWMLARAAGFDAGFGLATSLDALRRHGLGDSLLAAINHWETARRLRVFSADQQARLRDVNQEFHLEPLGPNRWHLTPVQPVRLALTQQTRQPGETQSATFECPNPNASQPLRFTLRLATDEKEGAATLEHPVLVLNDQRLDLPTLAGGQFVQATDRAVLLLDPQWHVLQTLPLVRPLRLAPGANTLRLEGRFRGSTSASAKLEVRSWGPGTVVDGSSGK